MILLDTSGLLAWIDEGQRSHREILEIMASVEGPYLLSPFVLAELDYLLSTRVGRAAQEQFLAEVGQGSVRLELFRASDVARALEIVRKFGDLDMGVADASLVVLAERHQCQNILTLDSRHFRVLDANRKPFRLLPADA